MEYLSPKEGGLPSPHTSAHTTPKAYRAELALLAMVLGVTVGLLVLCTVASANPVPVVRVLVEREKAGVQIDGFDLVVAEAATDKAIAHESRKASIRVKCTLGGKMEVALHPRTAKAAAGGALRVSGPLRVSSLGGFIRVGQNQYRDHLYVHSFNGDCIVVNHVDLEKYVAGLLNSEMSARWNLPTLMAQAVAARTYAIYQMQESSIARYPGLNPPFDLDSSVRDQVYEGAHQERYKAMRAVEGTRGKILVFGGKPIKAFYHSTCGGQTETPERVWGASYPYMRSVRCGYCDRSPRFNWVHQLSRGEVERRLWASGFLRGDLMSLRVVERNRLGRAEKVEVRGSRGAIVVVATKIRDIIGTLNIRSTDFTVVSQAGKIVFVGHGSGHGVGMCQWGAKTMGERGRSFAEILKHYYPAAELTKLY